MKQGCVSPLKYRPGIDYDGLPRLNEALSPNKSERSLSRGRNNNSNFKRPILKSNNNR
jgi:hypothetical protein